MLFVFSGCYVVPLLHIIYFYVFIVKAVWVHESAMRAQAKKMGVTNLRQQEEGKEKVRRGRRSMFKKKVRGWIRVKEKVRRGRRSMFKKKVRS